MKDGGIDFREHQPVESKTESVTKRQIFEKLTMRLERLQVDVCELPVCPELNPDIIVISGDQTFLFEPQNERASEVLQQCCGLSMEGLQVRERVRVHPSNRQKIINALRLAGLRVVC